MSNVNTSTSLKPENVMPPMPADLSRHKWRDAILTFLICTASGLTAIAPFESLAVVGAALLISFVAILPEMGLILSLYAGRFDSIPFRYLFPKWLYVTLPLLILTALGLGLMRSKYKGGLSKPVVGWGFPIAMSVVLLAGVIYTQGPVYGTSKALEFFLYTIPLYFLVQWILRGSFERTANLLICAFVVSGFFAVAGLASGGGAESRVAAFGGGPNVFSRLVSFGVLALPVVWYRFRGVIMRVGIIGGVALMSLAVLMSGSRGSFIALLICMLAVLFLWPTKGRNLWKIILFSILLAFSVWACIRFAEQLVMLTRLLMLFTEEGGGASVSLRVSMITTALQYAVDSPLLGRGTGSFPMLFFGSDFRYYPHNIFAEIFAENGLLGLGVLVGFLFFTLRKGLYLWKKCGLPAEQRRIVLAAGACFVFSVIVAQVSGDFYDNRMIWFFGSAVLALTQNHPNTRGTQDIQDT